MESKTDAVLDAVSQNRPEQTHGSLVFAAVVVALFWCQLFYQLRVEWAGNEQYGYGWFVPLLAASLFWRRWQDAPSPAVRISGAASEWLLLYLVVCLLVLLLPLRIIHEANLGWRSAQWLHGIILTLLTFCFFWRLGGWPWVRHFGFAVLFLLVAIPWPNRIEAPVVQGLMRFVAAVTVEVVGLFDVPAFRRGNLIEISSGIVSVDGACSGVRSLQTSLMVALLLGELLRFAWKQRLLLVLIGFVIAYLANVGRTSLLTWSAARQGAQEMEKLHTPVGIAVIAVVLGGVWLGTWFMGRRRSRSESAVPSRRDAPHLPALNSRWVMAALLWLGLVELGSAAWFQAGDRRAITNTPWSIQWPTNATSYENSSLSRQVREILRYDAAASASWQDAAGNRWSFVDLHWGAGNKNSFIGRGHTPDACFTGAGWHPVGEPPPARLRVNGIDLPVRRYVFKVDEKTAYVFLAFWEERSRGGTQELPLAYGLSRRIEAAFQGKRHLGLRKVEISIVGPSSSEQALNILQKGLEELIVPQVQ